MRPEHSARAVVELMPSGQTPSGAAPVLQHAPAAFHRMAVVTTVGRQEMPPHLRVPVGQRRRELLRPVDATAVRDHDPLCAGGAQEGHPWREIWAPPLWSTRGADLVEDCGGAIRDCPNDPEQHPVGDTAPGARADPRLACAALGAFALTRAQGPGRQARALGGAPPTRPGQGQTPEHRFVCLAHHARTPAGPVLEGRECQRRPRPLSGVRSEPSRGGG
jgi:hypothetical protein